MHFSPLTSQLRRELHVAKDVHGVVVTRVDNGSAADDVGLSEGDILVTIDQQPVNSPQEAAEKLKQVATSQKKSALLLLNRHGVTQYVGVNLGSNSG
jgi:serine protease Do